MIKKQLFILTALLSASVCFAVGIEETKWQYICPIEVNNVTGGYCSVEMTPEIYNRVKDDLTDIRIIESGGQQVPYMIVRTNDVYNRHKYMPTIINRVTTSDKSSMTTLDFGSQQIKNSIEIETAGSNFRRAVKVEGSNDNVEFFVLVERAFVFAIDGYHNQSRFETVDLPTNDYRYLRVTVYRMAEEKRQPTINNVGVYQDEKKAAPRVSVPMKQLRFWNDDANGVSVYEYDLGSRNLPIAELRFAIGDKYFYRYMTIEGRDVTERKIKIYGEDNRERFKTVQEDWRSITGCTIYRYATADDKICENLSVSFSHTYRYLRVTIRNYDDRPLMVQSAQYDMIPHRIIFEADMERKLKLYCGCGDAPRPQYDINYKIGNAEAIKTGGVMLGTIAENPLFNKAAQKPVAWTEKHKRLLSAILIAAVLAIGIFMVKSFKDIKPTESGEK